jgi:Holliday junction resolvasome RuvABC endonuclease subunit
MLAMSLGVMAALAAHAGIGLQGKSPMGLKAALTGNRTASKAEMIAAAREEYPETQSLFDLLRSGDHEHLADAVAAVHAFYGEAAP